MKSAVKKVSVNTQKNFEFGIRGVGVEIVEDDLEKPVHVTLTSDDGKTITLRLSPPDGDRLGRRIIDRAANALEHWRPSA